MKKKIALLCLAWFAQSTNAADIDLVGLSPGKAILVVDGAPPKAYSIGNTISGDVKLLEADRESATIIEHGKRQVLVIGQGAHRSAPSKGNTVTLSAGERGHFMATALINGVSVNMLVDTGASLIALPVSDAVRLGLNYKAGRMGRASTAGGIVNTYLLKLDTVKIGDVELHQVDASVVESGLSIALLGMSFLNRMDMRNDGDKMTLTKRY
ncbi:MAG: TIGR02281 family clan AA aspartic protease [Burkholderiales bacterium]|nr:TIGR02281 family clan AA aspartic protease [Burkholderiales bacterium]